MAMGLAVVVVMLVSILAEINGFHELKKAAHDSRLPERVRGYPMPYLHQRRAPVQMNYNAVYPCRNPPCITLTEAGMQNTKCSTGVFEFIARVELMILQLPKEMDEIYISIPADIMSKAKEMSEPLLHVCKRAKGMLMSLVGTIFEIPAKIMMESAKLFLKFLSRFDAWGRSCEGEEFCRQPLPEVHGLGPCAGQWPCTLPIAQKIY